MPPPPSGPLSGRIWPLVQGPAVTITAPQTHHIPPLSRAARLAVVLRPAEMADTAFLHHVYRSTRADIVALTGWSEDQKADFIAMQFQAQDRHYRQNYPAALRLIVAAGGGPVGRLYLARDDSAHHIIDIALAPAARGRGIGTALLRDLLDEAAALHRHMSLHVDKTNPAMALYRRLGFRTVADRGVHDLLVWSPPRRAIR